MQLSRTAQRPSSAAPLRLAAGAVFLAALVSLGGASRADAMTQPLMRIASVVAILVTAWRFSADDWSRVRVPMMFLAAFSVLCLAQLLPLPEGIWRSLPGHSQFATLLVSNGFSIGWRPSTMTPDGTLNALLATLPGFAVLMILGSLSREDLATRVPLGLLAAITVCALLGVLQVAGGWPFPYAITNVGTPVGFFANRNHSALLLAMTFPIGVACLINAARGQGRLEAPFVALFAFASLVATAMLLVNGSRGGIIAAAIGFLGSLALGLRSSGPKDRKKILALSGALGVGLIAIGMVFAIFARDLALQRLINPQIGAEMRVEALPTLVKLAAGYFPIGSGLGSFDPVFRVAEPDSMISDIYFNHAHDDWLELIIETGIVGLGLLLAFAGWALAKSWKAWQLASPGSLPGRLGSILLLQLGVASVFDYPVRTPFMLGMLAFAATCLAQPPGATSSTRARGTSYP